MGGSGDYFDVADTVLMMDAYLPYNVTADAQAIMVKYPLERERKTETNFSQRAERVFQQRTLQTRKGNRSKTDAKGLNKILMGRTEIIFDDTEQLADPSQTRMIAEMIQFLDRTNGLDGKTVCELLDQLEEQMDQNGLSSLTSFKQQHPGDIARPRRHEIAAVLNRIRTASVTRK
jgi:predicted ABC-class ATPase